MKSSWPVAFRTASAMPSQRPQREPSVISAAARNRSAARMNPQIAHAPKLPNAGVPEK